MGKRTVVRPQAQKDREVQRVQELRRSSAAEPVRNRKRYSRNDFRRDAQRGIYQDD